VSVACFPCSPPCCPPWATGNYQADIRAGEESACTQPTLTISDAASLPLATGHQLCRRHRRRKDPKQFKNPKHHRPDVRHREGPEYGHNSETRLPSPRLSGRAKSQRLLCGHHRSVRPIRRQHKYPVHQDRRGQD